MGELHRLAVTNYGTVASELWIKKVYVSQAFNQGKAILFV